MGPTNNTNPSQSQPAAEDPLTSKQSPEEPAWRFTTDASSPMPSQEAPHDNDRTITWTASEFIAHDKSALWYLAFTGIAVVVVGITYMLTRDMVATTAVVLMIICFGVLAARKPRVLPYRIDSGGVGIGEKYFPFGILRSFSVMDDGPLHFIDFLPLKRFRHPITIYYPPEQEEEILGQLSNSLPFEHRTLDGIDRLMRRVHF